MKGAAEPLKHLSKEARVTGTDWLVDACGKDVVLPVLFGVVLTFLGTGELLVDIRRPRE